MNTIVNDEIIPNADWNTEPGFKTLLEKLHINFETDGDFLFVGSKPSSNDHIIFISVIRPQLKSLLLIILPQLYNLGLTFQIVSNESVAENVMSGLMGEDNIGKVIIFFIPGKLDFGQITDCFVSLTKGFKGPVIPGEIHLGGLLYTNSRPNEISSGNLLQKRNNRKAILKRKYFLISTLKKDFKGDVLIGYYLKAGLWPSKCIIKEGKKYMIADDQGRDISDRLRWQYKVQKNLASVINVPKVIDLFSSNGNTYFVMEYIKGRPIAYIINNLYNGRQWIQLLQNEKMELFNLFFLLIESLDKIHQIGYIHRDLSPLNFLITKKTILYFVDLELVYDVNHQYPLPPFGIGSPGFTSPEQYAFHIPKLQEDMFGLGALMIGFFGNLPAAKYDFLSSDRIYNDLFSSTGNHMATEIITRCLHPIPCQRPVLQEVKNFMLSWREECLG